MSKTKEFAPGIPRRDRFVRIPIVTKPRTWKFGLQLHDADRAGRHFDLRIGDTQGHAHSWASRRLPGPGEKVLAVQQPTHTVAYMPFEGQIESGYGKGSVKSLRFEPTEVVKANPNRVTFYLNRGKQQEKFTLIRMDGAKWLLVNHTSAKITDMSKAAAMLDELKKIAEWEGQGGTGTVTDPQEQTPTSAVDPSGRLRTNDEPDAVHSNLKADKANKRKKVKAPSRSFFSPKPASAKVQADKERTTEAKAGDETVTAGGS